MTAGAGASLLCEAVSGVTGAGEENEAVAQQRTPARLRGAPSTATRNVEAAGPPGGPSSREYTNVTQVLEAYAAFAAYAGMLPPRLPNLRAPLLLAAPPRPSLLPRPVTLVTHVLGSQPATPRHATGSTAPTVSW